jgi:hypothetical protein
MKKVANQNVLNGSGYKGAIECSYKDLVSVFGKPHFLGSGDNKVQATWGVIINGLRYDDDIYDSEFVISIYDYKEDVKMKDVTYWHIGGKDWDNFDGVKAIFTKLKDSNVDAKIVDIR